MPGFKRGRLSVQFYLVFSVLVLLAAVLIATFGIAYRSARNQILDVGGEMFSKVLRDVIGLMRIMDERVRYGELTLEVAQEMVRIYVNGPKKSDGTRDISKSKMSVDDYMYVWATSFRRDRGTNTMHPFDLEGRNFWDHRTQGRYTVRETWGNIEKTGYVFRELWQNPGEPVYTFIAYQEYFEPWDWIVGCGGREEIIYERRLEGLGRKFWLVGLVYSLICFVFVYSFRRAEAARALGEEEVRELNRELERRVRERTAQLEVTNKELEAFAHSVSHDLRAPLRSIDGFSQALLEDYESALDAEGKDYLRRVRAASQHMGELIDDLLNLSRLTRAEMRRERVRLDEIAAEILADLRKIEPGREVDFAASPDLEADADPRLMRVALENLLGNAWKFTARRAQAKIGFGVVPPADAEKMGHAEKTVYFVRDNGAGFDMAYAGKLFGAFQRLHSAGEFPGTGVGLATVQRIVHRHGGLIWAEAAVDQGATFYFTLG